MCTPYVVSTFLSLRYRFISSSFSLWVDMLTYIFSSALASTLFSSGMTDKVKVFSGFTQTKNKINEIIFDPFCSAASLVRSSPWKSMRDDSARSFATMKHQNIYSHALLIEIKWWIPLLKCTHRPDHHFDAIPFRCGIETFQPETLWKITVIRSFFENSWTKFKWLVCRSRLPCSHVNMLEFEGTTSEI